MGIPLIRGRMFGDQDDGNSPHVAVISESLARQRWPDQDPIGQAIDFGNMDGNSETAHDRGHRRRCSGARPGSSAESHHLRRLPPARNERQFIAHHPDAQHGAGGRDRFRRARHFPRSRSRCSRQILHLRGRNGRLARGSPFSASSGGIIRRRCAGSGGRRHLRSCGLFGYAPHPGDRHSHGVSARSAATYCVWSWAKAPAWRLSAWASALPHRWPSRACCRVSFSGSAPRTRSHSPASRCCFLWSRCSRRISRRAARCGWIQWSP